MTREKKRQFGGYTSRDWREIRRKVLREVLEEEYFDNVFPVEGV